MNIIRCFLCFWVVLNLSRDEVVDGLKNKILEGPSNTIHSESIDEEDDDEDGSTSGTKKFEEPNYFDQSSQETNFKDTSSIVNEDLPDIRGKDVTPEQEILMAATQDSDYQQASVGDVNGHVFGALTGRSLRRTLSTDEKENEGTSPEDDESLSSDNLMGFGNFSESQGGDSEDQRQQIHYPVYQYPRPFGVHPSMKAPMPYPATIHVRLPGSVHTVPKVYPVHDYKDVPVPVRYHKVQNVDSPYYVPYKAGPDVEETHLDVFHPVNPCKNEGLLLHSNGGMVCLCTRDYQGRFCDEKLYCPSNPCLNGGVCDEIANNYRCRCPKGYRGYNCEVKDECALSPCKNDGTCVETLNGIICMCRSGFTGQHCESPDFCVPNPCRHWGTCIQTHTGHHECQCTPHFKGHLCETRRICYANPCKNGGKCIEDGGRYPCICPHGYKPPFCQDHVCSHHPCLNGGKCVAYGSVNGWHYKCNCPLLYRGEHCEIPNPCVTNPCLHAGTCIDSFSEYSGFPADWNTRHLHYICVCPPGYFGPKCEGATTFKLTGRVQTPLIELPIPLARPFLGRSRTGSPSVTDRRCKTGTVLPVAVPGREVSNVGQTTCSRDNICIKCHKNATCISNRCVCNDGFYGDGFYCRHIIDSCVPNPCYNNATCTHGPDDSFDCHCPPGYMPPLCKVKDVCVPNPCINGGTCKREVLIHPGHIHVSAEFTCVCPPGFAPPDCRNKTDDQCVPNPCLNGGKCQKDPSSTNGYICKCLGPHFVPPKCRCDCPQGDPSQKPPILASKCDLAGDCVCPAGYTFQPSVGCKSGRQDPCFEKPCLNNGTCVPEGDKYRCICTKNCKGNICQTCDFCPPDYCFNGGTCYSIGHKPYCRCRYEFLPPRCLFKKPAPKVYHCHPNPCHNGGKCTERENGFDCHCVPPFDGPHCEHDKCMDCDVHALCIHGQCRCRRGFRGSGYKGDCIKESVCPICPVNAMCVDNGCECLPGFMLVRQKCIPVMTP